MKKQDLVLLIVKAAEYYAQMIKEKQLADEEARQRKKDIINGIINAKGEPL